MYEAAGQKRETEAVELCETALGAGGKGRRPCSTLGTPGFREWEEGQEKASSEKRKENRTHTVSQRPKERLVSGSWSRGRRGLRHELLTEWFQRQGAQDVTCEGLAAGWWGLKTQGEGCPPCP